MAQSVQNLLLFYFQNNDFFNLPTKKDFVVLPINNPQCADEFTLFFRTENNYIKDITFQGTGCIFSRANLALICETFLHKRWSWVYAFLQNYYAFLQQQPYVDVLLERFTLFKLVHEYPNRFSCVASTVTTLLTYAAKTLPAQPTKAEWRKNIKAQNPGNVALIVKQLEQLITANNWQTIGFYYPFANEVNITSLLRQYLTLPHYKIVLPKYNQQKATMTFSHVTKCSQLVKKSFTYEPQDNLPVINPQQIEALIIPLVAYDAQLYRLGRGKGVYDRYCQSFEGAKIGLGFCKQQLDYFPHNTWDMRFDYLINEKQLFTLKSNHNN